MVRLEGRNGWRLQDIHHSEGHPLINIELSLTRPPRTPPGTWDMSPASLPTCVAILEEYIVSQYMKHLELARPVFLFSAVQEEELARGSDKVSANVNGIYKERMHIHNSATGLTVRQHLTDGTRGYCTTVATVSSSLTGCSLAAICFASACQVSVGIALYNTNNAVMTRISRSRAWVYKDVLSQ